MRKRISFMKRTLVKANEKNRIGGVRNTDAADFLYYAAWGCFSRFSQTPLQ